MTVPIESVNPERIRWCCRDFSLPEEQLAPMVNIAPPTLARALDGQGGLSFVELQKIADYFGRGVLFFLESAPLDTTRVHTAEFHRLENQKPNLPPAIKKLLGHVERHRDIYRHLRTKLQATKEVFSPPKLPPQNPRQAAAIVRDWLQLTAPQANFDTYRKALARRGVLVFCTSRDKNSAWYAPKDTPIVGFNLYAAVGPVLVVHARANPLFTLMHELAHILLHRESSIDDREDLKSTYGKEQEANAFAQYFCAHTEWPITSQPNKFSPIEAAPAYRFMTRDDLPVYQVLEHAHAVPDPNHLKPLHIFGDAYVRTVLDALEARHITLSKASNYLDDLEITDLPKLARALTA